MKPHSPTDESSSPASEDSVLFPPLDSPLQLASSAHSHDANADDCPPSDGFLRSDEFPSMDDFEPFEIGDANEPSAEAERAGSTKPLPYDSPLEHLADHLRRLSALLAAHFARLPTNARKRAGQVSDEDIYRLASFGGLERPPATHRLWQTADELGREIRQREDNSTIDLPLRRIQSRFELSDLERDVLLLTAAPHLDPQFKEHWSSCDMDLNPLSIGMALSVFARSFEEGVRMRRLFSLSSPLFAQSLLLAQRRAFGESDFLDTSLEVPRRVVGELLGESHVAEELVAFSRLHVPTVPLSQVVLPAETKELVLSLVKNHSRFLERRAAWGIDEVVTYGKAMVLLFSGPPGTGKTMLANAVAHELGKRIFLVDTGKLIDGGRDIESNLDAVFREARLLDSVLFFDECEQLFTSRRMGNSTLPILLTRIEQFDGVALLATNMGSSLDEALGRRLIASIEFRAPTTKAREEIWRRHLPPALPLAADVDLDALAERYELSGGLIKNAVLAAVQKASARDEGPVTQGDLEHGARLQLRVSEDVESQIIVPEVDLDSVVLPQDLRARLDRFIQAARVSSTVLGDWGLRKVLGRTSASTALLSGPSGTGKSMTAEAIAKALDRPLLRCSLPSIISKYVGDTSKNLQRLFDSARKHRAVLVFDEADALFARRVAVNSSNDRFANAETGALLTQFELHDGVVILTTNLLDSLDPAFERRLLVQVNFPLPDTQARAQLWRRLLSSDAPLAADIDPLRLARLFELSGAAIRNAMMQAALEAASASSERRQITQAMLERAAAEQCHTAPRAIPSVAMS